MFDSLRRHHALVVEWQTQRSQKPSSQDMGVQVSPSAPIRPRSPTGRGPALNAGKCRFEACRGYALVAQLVEAAASRAACCRFESCAAHQFVLPSPSGKGIWFTPRHSAVRIRQGAPIKTASQASESEKRGPRPITAWYRRGSTSRWHRSGREALNPNGEGADF